MQNRKTTITLSILILILAAIATLTGILSKDGTGTYPYLSIRGQEITIYGIGLYKHMSADVAIQGIAQDYVTLFLALPLLALALIKSSTGNIKWRLLLAGTLFYIFLTYLFYMNMAMYNALFLVYIALTSLSFFALAITLLSIDLDILSKCYRPNTPIKFLGGFLIGSATLIALLWLSVIVPPLLDQTIVPAAVQHYTTLTVQAFDLALFLPISIVSGLLLIKKSRLGYLMAPIYLVFLSILMTALFAKIVAMALVGVNVVPAVFIIPCVALLAMTCLGVLMRNIRETTE